MNMLTAHSNPNSTAKKNGVSLPFKVSSFFVFLFIYGGCSLFSKYTVINFLVKMSLNKNVTV